MTALFDRVTVRTPAGFVTTITVGTEVPRPVLTGSPRSTALDAIDAAEEAFADLLRTLVTVYAAISTVSA